MFFIWIDVTEYFKNPKFQIRAFRGFCEIALLLTYVGTKTTLEWPKLVFETIFPTDRGYFCIDRSGSARTWGKGHFHLKFVPKRLGNLYALQVTICFLLPSLGTICGNHVKYTLKSKQFYTSRGFCVNFMLILCQFYAKRPLQNRTFFQTLLVWPPPLFVQF